MASPTRWTWVWASSRSWWWTGRPACCSPRGRKEPDTTERLSWTDSRADLTQELTVILGGSASGESASNAGDCLQHIKTWVWSLGPEDPLEEEMIIHSSILAWRIPWTEMGYSPWGRKEWDWVTKPPPNLIRNRRYSLNTFNHFEIISYLVEKC